MIQAILWDVDGTLLDFRKSEKTGIRECLEEIGYTGFSDELLERYSRINHGLWKELERGEITKQEVLVGRFKRFFRQENIACPDIAAFNRSYQEKLGRYFFENENALELLRELHGNYKQYVVTNGTVEAQKNKLHGSGIGELMDGIFISDEIGSEKPTLKFFEPVLAVLGGIPKQEILIIGDSLTSDMLGGNNIGIRCCWYNPEAQKNETDVKIDYEIRTLREIPALLASL